MQEGFLSKTKNAPGEKRLEIDKFPILLQRRVKSRASDKGISIKEFVAQALEYALDNDHIIREKPIEESTVVDSASESQQGPV